MSILVVEGNEPLKLTELAKAVTTAENDLIYVVQEIDGKLVSIGIERSVFLAGLIPQGKGIISGGATYSGSGLVFNVSAINYYYAGSTDFTDPVDVTLADGGGQDRIDAIVVNAETNLIEVVQGTEAADPITPQIAEEQILVQYVFIAAGATTPTIDEEVVYKENSEWVTSTSGTITGTIDFASTDDPYSGAVCVSVDECDKRARIRFTNASDVDLNEYTVAVLYIRFPTALAANKKLYVNALESNVSVGNTVNLMSLGLDRNSTDWQQIVIPTSSFNASAIDSLQLRMVGGPNNDNASWFVDNIILYTGFAPPAGSSSIQVLDNGDLVGSTSKLNFEDSDTITVNTTQNPDGTITVSFDGSEGGAVDSVNGETGDVVLDLKDINDVPPYPMDGNYWALVEKDGVLEWKLKADGNVNAVTGGDGIEVDNSAPSEPVVSLSPASLASLVLANSALQPGDNISELTNDAGFITGIANLSDVGDVPPYPNDGNVYILAELAGIIGWFNVNSLGFITEADVIGTSRQYTKGQGLTNVALSIVANETTIDLSDSNSFTLDLNDDTELKLPVSDRPQSVQVIVTNNGGNELTFEAGYKIFGDLPSQVDAEKIRLDIGFTGDGQPWVFVTNETTQVSKPILQLKMAWADEKSDLVEDPATVVFTDYVTQPFVSTDWIYNVGEEESEGQAIEVDIHKDGVSIWTTRPTISAGSALSTGGVQTSAEITWLYGSKIEVYITQVGTTVAGKGLKGTPIGYLI